MKTTSSFIFDEAYNLFFDNLHCFAQLIDFMNKKTTKLKVYIRVATL